MKVLVVALAAILLLTNIPIIDVPTVHGADGRQIHTTFHFEENYIQVLNNTNTTMALNIRTVGSPFFGDLDFYCPKDFDCPVTAIPNVFFSPGVSMRINFTFIAHLNGSFMQESSIEATLQNKSLFIEEDARLDISVIFPASYEIVNDWAQCTNYEHSFGGPQKYYYMQCNGYRPSAQNISMDIKITNHDENISINGFFGIVGMHYFPQASIQFTFFNDTAISISPKSSVIVTMIILKPISEKWSMSSVNILAFKSNKTSQQKSIPNINMKASPPKRMEFQMQIYLFSNIGLWIETPGEEKQDIWNGTNITIHVYNVLDKPLLSEYVILEDTVDQYTSFNNEKYYNTTTVQIGDIAPLTEKNINCTIYSKASGTHYISAILSSNHSIKTMFDSKIIISSGLKVTYVGFDLQLTTIPSRNSEIREPVNITMLINNPRGYEGEVSLSIHIIGWEGQLDKVHGNGWLDESIFVDIEPKSVWIKSVNETVFFKITPKVSGAIRLIPVMKVKEKLLILNENAVGQEWTHPCYGNDIETGSSALPGICAGYSYDHLSTYVNKGVEHLSNLVYCVCAISVAITIIAYIRRYRLQSKYAKIIDRRTKGKQKTPQKQKKHRKSNNS